MRRPHRAHDGIPLAPDPELPHMTAISLSIVQDSAMRSPFRSDDRRAFEQSVLSQAAFISASALVGLVSGSHAERRPVAEDLSFHTAAPRG